MTTEQAISIVAQLGDRAVQRGVFNARSEVMAFEQAIQVIAKALAPPSTQPAALGRGAAD